MNSLDYLPKLNAESSYSASVQIANHIRAAIKTGKLTPGQELPSNQQLQDHYGVVRETVKRAVTKLSQDGLLVTQQGKKPRVRSKVHRAIELRPHVSAAFEEVNVSIDFAGFSGETLQGATAEAFDRIRLGELSPETITIRAIVSDMTKPLALPRPINDETDSETVRRRMTRITDQALDQIANEVHELQEMDFIKSGTLEARMLGIAPTFKMFVLNETEVFFGFYPIVQHSVKINGESAEIFDPMGKDAHLSHFSSRDSSTQQGIQFLDSARAWFDSAWTTIATERRIDL
ncbi:winged helix-turn-helix domain-containing protein [Glycomyces xiaoerkulensis]|uniref:winged helix-turn-helix domain-containing protein n=1 Tax=Glycomyces xiaoerkulensis TaxID=2038139 RepID=UPI000C25C399|nr:winged helix-turn-helix domain-containing protein [Glycomyces xiaoerkulensis]